METLTESWSLWGSRWIKSSSWEEQVCLISSRHDCTIRGEASLRHTVLLNSEGREMMLNYITSQWLWDEFCWLVFNCWWSIMINWSGHLKCIMTRQMMKTHLKPNEVEAVLWFSTDDAKAIFHCEQSLVDFKWFQFMLMTIFIILLRLRLRSILIQNCYILWNLETGRIDWVQWLCTQPHWHQQDKGLQSLVSIIKWLIVFFCRLFDLPGRCGRWIVKMCVPRFLFKTPCFPVDFDLLVQMKFWTI